MTWHTIPKHSLVWDALNGGPIARATCSRGKWLGVYRMLRETAEQDFRSHMAGVELKAPGES